MNRLREYDIVTVNVPLDGRLARTLDMFDARVLAMAGPTAALEPVDLLEALRLPPVLPGTLLSFHKDGSLVGLKGTLRLRRDSGDLRFTVADGVQLNRRAATRIKVSLPVQLHRLGTTEQRSARTVDLSADGLLIETDLAAAAGDLLEVTISIDADVTPVIATAQVVRAADGLLALQLGAAENSARSRLGRLVVDHNREQLRQRESRFAPVEF